MPSPTERMRPTSETLASAPKPLICSFRIAEISAARTSMSFLPRLCGFERELQRVELGFDGGVELARSHAYDETADEAVIDRRLAFDLRPERLGQRFKNSGLFGDAKRRGGDDFGAPGPALTGDQVAV